MKFLVKTLLISLSFAAVPFLSKADDDHPRPHAPHGASVPFDGGLSMLIAAGVSYGFKRAYDKRRKGNTEK